MGGVRGQGNAAKPTLVFSSTPLICLTRAGLADKLSHLLFELATTRTVYDEVMAKGAEKQVEEASELRELFDSRIIEVVGQTDEETVEKLRDSGIHLGEATVISLAYKLNAVAIIDDRRAGHIARTLGIGLSSTPHIIIQLVKQRIIAKQEARQAIDRIVEEGWYCSAKSYSEMIEALERA